MKKTICLITNWYPTKDNPYKGLFFKEQAFAVADQFDFLILHYKEIVSFLPGRMNVQRINIEKNTIEYDAYTKIPFLLVVIDEIYSLYIKFSKKRTLDGVGKYVLNARKKYTERIINILFSEKIKEKIDVFYCVDGQFEAFVISCAAQSRNKPYVIGEHAPVPFPGNVISDINKESIEKADLFFAISQDKIRQLMLQNICLPKTIYIGNLINESDFTIEPYKNNSGVKTLLIVASHSYFKNYDMFIKVMNHLTEITEKPFSIMIVGYAADKGYSKNVKEFENKILHCKFYNRVKMIPEVPHEEMNRIYQQADAFVMTSIQEGQPVSALEAACCGLPIFSTRCGGVEDYVDDNIGRIYNVNDWENMASGLKAFIEGKILFNSQIIRRKIVDRYGTKAFINNFCGSLYNIIKND